MNQLDDHISKAKRELSAAQQRGDQASARHYASELNDLLTYKKIIQMKTMIQAHWRFSAT